MSTTKTVAERVAEACGLRFVVRDNQYTGPRVYRIWDAGDADAEEWFTPDIDESDAVLAAEKYGLCLAFHNCEMHGLILDSNGATGWGVSQSTPQGSQLIGQGTFCQAICSAILHLESRKPAVG